MQIRLAELSDLKQVQDIYNHAILNLTATFEEIPKSYAEYKEWFTFHQNAKYPLIVAVQDSQVLGWASISSFNPRSAYRFTGETSVYIKEDFCGQGIGSNLLQFLLSLAQEQNYHTLIALIAGNNQTSINLHHKFGFEIAGNCKEVGYKFGNWLDLTIMQKQLHP